MIFIMRFTFGFMDFYFLETGMLPKEVLWVLEQTPGEIWSADQTMVLG